MKNQHLNRIRITSLLIVGFSLCTGADGRTWHVSGKRLTGIKQEEQVRTISEAVGLVEPGDMVIVHNGFYHESVVIEKNGLPDKPIIFQAATGANVIAYNRDAQTWGWFDIPDNQHWPAKDNKAGAGELSLETLSLTLRDNLYFAGPGADLFNWGVTWKKHKRYEDLEQVQEELDLERGSKVAEFAMKDFSTLDFHIPADSPAVKMQCYPQGKIPGVRLGILE